MTKKGYGNGRGWIVYSLHRQDGAPFYVGKGRPWRPYAHIMDARRGVGGHRARLIRKMLAEGVQPTIAVALRTDDEPTAFAEERRLIAVYRLAGFSLTNRTDGGDGTSGRVQSPEERERRRNANLGQRRTDESRQRISESHRGLTYGPQNEEHRRKIGDAHRGKVVSEESRAKMSAAAKNRPPISEQTRQNYQRASTGRRHSEETRAKMAAIARQRPPMSEETRRQISATRKAAASSPSTTRKEPRPMRDEALIPDGPIVLRESRYGVGIHETVLMEILPAKTATESGAETSMALVRFTKKVSRGGAKAETEDQIAVGPADLAQALELLGYTVLPPGEGDSQA